MRSLFFYGFVLVLSSFFIGLPGHSRPLGYNDPQETHRLKKQLEGREKMVLFWMNAQSDYEKDIRLSENKKVVWEKMAPVMADLLRESFHLIDFKHALADFILSQVQGEKFKNADIITELEYLNLRYVVDEKGSENEILETFFEMVRVLSRIDERRFRQMLIVLSESINSRSEEVLLFIKKVIRVETVSVRTSTYFLDKADSNIDKLNRKIKALNEIMRERVERRY